MLDVRRLRLLRELAARGTLAAVADAMQYTPSAVSQQLALLEKEAGVALLERVGRGVQLTDAARRLVEHTEAVLERLEIAEAELAGADGSLHGTVRIASFQTVATAIVAPAIVELGTQHPGIDCVLMELEAEEALPLLRTGQFDVAIAEEYEHAPRPRDAALDRFPLCEDRLLLVLPEGHRLARRRRIELTDLADEHWATTRPGTAFAAMVERTCRLAGFEPDTRYRANDIRLYLHLAAAGMAVSLVPSLGRPWETPGIVVRDDLGLRRSVFVATRHGSGPRPALDAVVAALRSQAAALPSR